MSEYIIVGDSEKCEGCLLYCGFKEKEHADRVLNRMLNNPTRGDEQIMRGKSSIRVQEVASKDCWWNYNCD